MKNDLASNRIKHLQFVHIRGINIWWIFSYRIKWGGKSGWRERVVSATTRTEKCIEVAARDTVAFLENQHVFDLLVKAKEKNSPSLFPSDLLGSDATRERRHVVVRKGPKHGGFFVVYLQFGIDSVVHIDRATEMFEFSTNHQKSPESPKKNWHEMPQVSGNDVQNMKKWAKSREKKSGEKFENFGTNVKPRVKE